MIIIIMIMTITKNNNNNNDDNDNHNNYNDNNDNDNEYNNTQWLADPWLYFSACAFPAQHYKPIICHSDSCNRLCVGGYLFTYV